MIDGQGDGSRLELFFMDTLSVQAGTIKEDSLPGNSLNFQLLGALNDPIFGPSSVGIVSQMSLLEPNSNFDNTVEPDSAILFIPLIAGMNFYGNPSNEQQINVYELQDPMNKSVYYQKQPFATIAATASSYTGRLYMPYFDSVRFKNEKFAQPAALRVKLSYAMAKRLMSLPKEAYATNTGFQANFNGLAILPEGNLFGKMGGYGVFAMNTTDLGLGLRAKVLLYYKDTNTLAFGFNSKEQTVTTTMTGPYPAAIQNQIDNPGQAYASTYVQGLSGVKTFVKIPWLNNLVSQGQVAINKAEIVFYIDKGTVSEELFAPPRLNLFQPYLPGSVRNDLLADAIDLGSGFVTSIGGDYNESAGSYTFTITRQMQKWLNAFVMKGENKNFGMYLTVPTGSPVIGARGVIDQSKTKVKIAYTKLN